MKLPERCPFCKDPLTNEYSGKNEQHLVKQCNKRVTHKICFKANPDHSSVYFLSIPFSLNAKVFWFPDTKVLLFDSITVREKLPYFEPDLNNYQKLINKLKLYLTFS